MQHEKRVALVVGNGAYDNTPSLPNPPNDAAALATSLRRLDFDVLDGRDLKLSDFAGRIRDFGRALRQAHVALFYYAGHGLQVGSQNYVVPVDAALEHEADVQLELIAVQTILAQMEVGNRTSLVILDACRNNPLARNLARAMGTRSVAIGEGLGRIESGIGTFIAFATSPNRVALDGGSGTNSPFTAALIHHVETPGLTIADVMMRVRRDVIAATEKMREGPQVPWDSSSLTAPFYFKRPVSSGPHQPAPPDPAVTTEPTERDWERFQIAETEHVPTIEAYIAQYQTSAPLWAARARQRPAGVQALIAEQAEARRREHDEAEVRRARASGRAGRFYALIMEGKEREAAEAQQRQEEDRKAGIVRVRVGTGRGKDEERRIAPGSGQTFKDFVEGPEMVIVPSGEFMMGSPDGEEGRMDAEGPRHRMIIPILFAIGRYAVTFAEWDAFVAAEGGVHKPGDRGWARGDRPVIDVSWDDIRAYVAWLRRETRKRYRLPSEAEWEYAARAGTQTPFWWGSSINPDQANYHCNDTYGGGPKGAYRHTTLPVKSFEPNPWGLYQMHGNVCEWVEDGWHDGYADKPEAIKANGGAWMTEDGGAHVLRGGSWNSNPRNLRSADRYGNSPDYRSDLFGFRVARTVSAL